MRFVRNILWIGCLLVVGFAAGVGAAAWVVYREPVLSAACIQAIVEARAEGRREGWAASSYECHQMLRQLQEMLQPPGPHPAEPSPDA